MDLKKSIVVILLITLVIPQGIFAMKHKEMELKDIQFKGDLRLRHQISDSDQDSSVQNDKGRLRFRYSIAAPVNEKTSVHARLATGSSPNPKSTNQTLGGSSSNKMINLDYAFVKMETHYGHWTLGKMKNPLCLVSDMMWDTDITPEGIAFKRKLKDLKLTAAYLVLDNVSAPKNNPHMLVLQAATKLEMNRTTFAKLIATVYSADNVKGNTLAYSAGTNTGTVTAGGNAYDYNPHVVSIAGKLIKKDVKRVKAVALFADYLNNTGVDDLNQAGLIGIGIGDYRIKDKGEWNAKLSYRKMQKDSTLDILTDADAFGGSTNIKGTELGIQYGVCKNTVVGFDYYQMKDNDSGQINQVFQTDLMVKF